MDQYSENINVFSPCINQNKSRVLAEGTVTRIPLVTTFVFLVCLSTSHRGDKAVLGLSLVKSHTGCSAASPARCCACCFAPFPCQPYSKDLKAPSGPFHALRRSLCSSTSGTFPVASQCAHAGRVLPCLRWICTGSSALLCRSHLSPQLSSRKRSVYSISCKMPFPRQKELVAYLVCQPTWRVRRGTFTFTHAIGCCGSHKLFCG